MKSLLKATLLLTFLLAFTPCAQSADYFWIGGTGNWSDISHWATTSGGVITHTQAPTANDDVFFDNNSFNAPGQVVTLDGTIIFFRSMLWTSNFNLNDPTLEGDADVTMNVFGSLELNAAMNFNFTGRTLFAGTASDQVINYAAADAGRDVIFDGTGTWNLQSGLNIDSLLQFNAGTLNTNGSNIDCQYFHSPGTATRTLNLASTVFSIRGTTLDPNSTGNPDLMVIPMRLTATNLTIDPGSSLILLTNTNVDVWFEEFGNLAFNRLILSESSGSSRILHRANFNNVANYPTVTYNEIHVFHAVEFGGSPTINNLLLTPGFNYTFESGQVFTFDFIQASGSCLQPLSLASTVVGDEATFTTDDDITVVGINLHDIHTQGTGTFTANDVVDLGNNTGWTLNPRASEDFFWIGDTGNWDDVAHWSFTSGGPSAGCLPTAIDDVYFDANSFNAAGQSVTINVINAFCRSMFWTGVTNLPTLAGPDGFIINIGGSLTLTADMQNDFAGDFRFASSLMGNTITTAGQPLNGEATFTGTTGEWILQDDLFVQDRIYIESGTWRANGQRVDVNQFLSSFTTERTIDLTNSYLLSTSRNLQPIIRLVTDNLTLIPDNSTVESGGAGANGVNFSGNDPIEFNNFLITSTSSATFTSVLSGPGSRLMIDSFFIETNNVSLSGNNAYNYVYLAPGITTRWLSSTTQVIGTLDPNGDCENGATTIRSNVDGQTAIFQIDQDQTFDRLVVHDVNQTGTGQLTANNSVDGGGNTNWTFNTGGGRTLYWVGDNGSWVDTNHWSLSSGGPGGECIPTPVDDVIFDNNSFPSGGNPFISNDGTSEALCRDLTINVVPGITITHQLSTISIYGSLTIDADLGWSTQSIFFRGTTDHDIRSGGNLFQLLNFNGPGNYTLRDPLAALQIRFRNGTLNTNDFAVNLDRLSVSDDNTCTLNLASSYLTLTGTSPLQVNNANAVINAGTSFIELTNAQTNVFINSPATFYQVRFSNNNGSARLQNANTNYQRLDFAGNGEIVNALTTDSLFFAPGKAYVLESNETQTINNYWHILGNNCTPISLTSSLSGSPATVTMPNTASIRADFIQMRDQIGAGGAAFNAGAGSTDIANSNTGWVFATSPEFIDVGFLGQDITLCDDAPVTLSAYSFSSNEGYLWQDGSTDSIFVANQSGSYSVEVTFDNNCSIQDTIQITTADDFAVDLPDDPTICDTDNLVLNAAVSGATYLWQDGSTNSSFAVTESGTYAVQVDVGGCVAADTTTVVINTTPIVDLGLDQILCSGDAITLMANVAADNYLWQDGSTADSFTATTAGLYTLQVSNGNCSSTDTLLVTAAQDFAVDLPDDPVACDSDNLVLNANVGVAGATYLWQDGSTNSSFAVSGSGAYAVQVTVGECVVADTTNVVVNTTPIVNLGMDQVLCSGDAITLLANVMADNYLWQDGSTNDSFTATTAGLYTLQVSNGNCSSTDTLLITAAQDFVVDLPDDPVACDNDNLVLNADTGVAGATYLWQDGSTNSSFAVSGSGAYAVQVTVGECVVADTTNVVVNTTPIVNLGMDQVLCSGDAITLLANVMADNYLWQDGSTNDSFIATTAGLYTLQVSNGNCSSTDTLLITAAQDFAVDLPDDPVACDSDNLVLNADVGVAGATYLWQDGSTNSSFAVNGSGSYAVQVTVGECVVADTTQVTIEITPALDLGPDLGACSSEDVVLTSNVAAESFLWQDGSTANDLTVTTSGEYWLQATNGNCTATDTISVTFTEAFTVDLGIDTLLCDQPSFLLEADITDASYLWQDGSTTSTFTASSIGDYAVLVTLENCTASDTINLTFQNNPPLNLPDQVTACSGEAAELTAPSGADSYEWSNGDMTSTFTTLTAGIYDVVTTFGQCQLMDTFEVVFNTTPTIDLLGPDLTICPGDTVFLQASTDVGTITWSDNSTSDVLPVFTAGNFAYQADNNGCISSDTITIDIATLEPLDLEANYTACAGTTFSITTNVTADSYNWSNGNTGPTFTSTVAGVFGLTANFAGCLSTTTFIVDFVAPPEVDLGPDQTGCAGDVIELDAGLAGVWQDGSTSSTFIATAGGWYSIEVGSGDCISQDSVLISFTTAPSFDLGDDQTLCEGDSLLLTLPVALNLISWNDGNTENSRTITQSGSYSAILSDDNGCTTSDTITIGFASPPNITVSPDTTICDTQNFTVRATTDQGIILWPDGSTGNSFTTDQAGAVPVIVDNEGCISAATVVVNQKECVIFEAYIANIFSPNNDGTNDTFFPQFDPAVDILSYQLSIYDRWGSQLFTSENLSDGWDGRSRGQLLPAGVYVYFIEITYQDDLGMNSEVLKGSVSLIR